MADSMSAVISVHYLRITAYKEERFKTTVLNGSSLSSDELIQVTNIKGFNKGFST
jgi:thioredoxin-related protein